MIVKGNLDREASGQRMAFALSLVALVGGVYLILQDKGVSGLSIVIADIAALAGLFYYAKRKQTAGKKA